MQKLKGALGSPGLLVFYTLLILLGAITPASSFPESLLKVNDKFIHFFQFLLLFVLAQNTFQSRFSKSKSKQTSIRMAIYYGIFFSAFTELLQIGVEDRSADLYDGLFDLAGTFTGALIFIFKNSLGKQ